MTIDDYIRKSAWETAMCAGVTDYCDWVADELETSPAAAETLTYCSYVGLAKWPPIVTRLVSEQLDLRNADNDSLLSARLAAAQVVAAAENLAAVDVLLNCGLSGSGSPLRSTTELVGDVAERLANRGVTEIVDRLLSYCEDRDRGNSRMSAIAGLQRLAGAELIGREKLQRILVAFDDQSLPEYATAALIWIAASFPEAKDRSHFIERIINYGEQTSAFAEIRFQSLQALIHLGVWMDHMQAVHRILALSENALLAPAVSRNYQGWQSYALGLLVIRDPQTFLQAAIQVIEEAPGEAVHLLLRALDRTPISQGEGIAELGRSAIRRTIRVLARSFGETDNFKLIARLVPSDFLNTKWEESWSDWMPPVRSALADALVLISYHESFDRGRAATLLEGLLSDSSYLVRRAAGRAFSRIDQERFRQLCSRWMNAGNTELRVRCAENAQWLRIDDNNAITNSLIRELLEDIEPSVRSAAKRSSAELRNKEWGASALARVCSGDRRAGAQWVSSAYCYGQALIRLSDDETITALEDLRDDHSTPINVKNWVKKLIKDAERHWQELTKKWPDNLLPWAGQLEEFVAEFTLDDCHFRATISLWLRRPADPTDLASWGGSFLLPSMRDRTEMFGKPRSKPVTLVIPGRRSGQLWYSSADMAGRIVFIGTGAYPDLINAPIVT